jgi:hypothetical protein
MDAIVRRGEAYIHYKVFPEADGIFQAQLIRYEGCPTEEPPMELTLVKSFRRWTGSVNDSELLNGLGEVIDSINSGRLRR